MPKAVRRLVAFTGIVSAVLLLSFQTQANPWAQVSGPAKGKARVIGTYTNGCVVGAQGLALTEPGLQAMRPSRKRNFGHPALLRFMRALGKQALKASWGTVLVGDLGQARGGPTFANHVSHQSGLDVDVWFRTLKSARVLSDGEREKMAATQYVSWKARRLSKKWGAPQTQMVMFAARHREVQRVFVSPVIKQELCQTAGADRAWLTKIRPWYGHGDHMHVRLLCPSGSPECAAQAAVPRGDGCGAELSSWLKPKPASSKPTKPKKRKKRVLPPSCQTLVRNP